MRRRGGGGDQPFNINNDEGKTSEVRSGGDQRNGGNSKETKECFLEK